MRMEDCPECKRAVDPTLSPCCAEPLPQFPEIDAKGRVVCPKCSRSHDPDVCPDCIARGVRSELEPRDPEKQVTGWEVAKDGPIPELSPVLVPIVQSLEMVGRDESGLPTWVDATAFLRDIGAPEDEWEVYQTMWRIIAGTRSIEYRKRMEKREDERKTGAKGKRR